MILELCWCSGMKRDESGIVRKIEEDREGIRIFYWKYQKRRQGRWRKGAMKLINFQDPTKHYLTTIADITQCGKLHLQVSKIELSSSLLPYNLPLLSSSRPFFLFPSKVHLWGPWDDTAVRWALLSLCLTTCIIGLTITWTVSFSSLSHSHSLVPLPPSHSSICLTLWEIEVRNGVTTVQLLMASCGWSWMIHSEVSLVSLSHILSFSSFSVVSSFYYILFSFLVFCFIILLFKLRFRYNG